MCGQAKINYLPSRAFERSAHTPSAEVRLVVAPYFARDLLSFVRVQLLQPAPCLESC